MTIATLLLAKTLWWFGHGTSTCPCHTGAFSLNMRITAILQLLMLWKITTINICNFHQGSSILAMWSNGPLPQVYYYLWKKQVKYIKEIYYALRLSLVLPGPCCAPPSIICAPTACCSFDPTRSQFVLVCTCLPSVCTCCCCSSTSRAFGLHLFVLVPLHVPSVCAHSPLFAPADAIPAAVAIAHMPALVLALGLCVPTLHASLLFVDLTCKSNISIFLIKCCTYLGLGHAAKQMMQATLTLNITALECQR